MKTIFKYLISAGYNARLPFTRFIFYSPVIAKKALTLCGLMLSFQSAFSQRDWRNLQPDSMVFIAFGASSLSINRQAFDQWTRANYNLVESHHASTLIDFGIISGRFDFGLGLNVGSAFSTNMIYLGTRLTRASSKISSWINFEWGELLGLFTNIAPLNYVPTPDQQGQKLVLRYRQNYIGLSSKNFLNFLHFTAKVGRAKIPFNTGFYLGAEYQPGSKDWRYGYYNADTVFVGRRIHNIPKLGRVQVTGGVFVGF